MSLFKKILKKLKYPIGFVLILSTILAAGFLSFTGILAIWPFLSIAIAGFLLATSIEINVFRENIWEGIKKLLTANFVRDAIIINTLEEKINNLDEDKISIFYQDYVKQKELIKKLSGHKLSSEKKREKKAAVKTLKSMQHIFIDYVLSADKNLAAKSKLLNDEHFSIAEINKLKSKIHRRWFLLGISWIINILGGAGCAFITLQTLLESIPALSSLIGISLSATVLTAMVWPLAIMAALGYIITMYHTLTDILTNPSFKAWFKKKFEYFQRKEEKNTGKYIARVIGSALLLTFVIAAGIFATIATAGTWWTLMKNFPVIISYITVPAEIITNIIFNLSNSLDAVKKILKHFSLRIAVQNFGKLLQTTKSKEHWLQFINPIRFILKIVEIPFKAIIFIGHLFSIGAASDRLGDIPPLITAIAAVGSEAFEDLPYTFDIKTEHKKHHGGHHHHDHGDVTTKFLKFVLSPLYLLSAVWAYLTSRLNKDKENRGNFSAFLKNTFGVHNKKPISENQEIIIPHSSAYRIIAKTNKEIKRLQAQNDTVAPRKKGVFINVRNELINIINDNSNRSILAASPSGIATEETTSLLSKSSEKISQADSTNTVYENPNDETKSNPDNVTKIDQNSAKQSSKNDIDIKVKVIFTNDKKQDLAENRSKLFKVSQTRSSKNLQKMAAICGLDLSASNSGPVRG